ncbi:MAG: hypothetical protein ABIR06_16760 [Cyclobacteriaceae bacterium]
MKLLISCLTVFSLFLTSSIQALGQDKTEIAPVKFLERVAIQGKNEYTYYILSQKVTTSYRIEGPGKLYVNFRVGLTGDSFKSKASAIKIVQSEYMVKTYKLPELFADSLKAKNSFINGFPTKIQKFEIDVPPGKHTYRIYSTNEDPNVYVRSFYQEYPKPVWEDLIPINQPSKKEVRYVKSKKVLEYYTLTKKEEYKFSIKDTSQIRLIIRPSFDNKMLEDTKINISLINKTTGEEQSYKFSSKRANDIEFVNDLKNIPGKLVTFYVALHKPKNGEDIYDVRVLSGVKSAVIRMSYNKKLKK